VPKTRTAEAATETVSALVPAYSETQKQQAVAAYTACGGSNNAQKILGVWWGTEELPTPHTIRNWVAAGIAPTPDQEDIALRVMTIRYRNRLWESTEAAMDIVDERIKNPKEKLFNVIGGVKTYFDALAPMLKGKANTIPGNGGINWDTGTFKPKSAKAIIEGEWEEKAE